MKIAVIGTGYVGLVTGTCFADSGNDVICVDIDRAKVDALRQGEIPIYEPGLSELVLRNSAAGRLAFTTEMADAVQSAQLVFLAVGTPSSDDGSADLSILWSAVDGLAPHLAEDAILILKSTVPVGTNTLCYERLRKSTGRECRVASNPEFLKEGTALDDFKKPDRVVVGVREEETGRVLQDLYRPLLRTERPFLVMSPESAEMTKYVANTLLATKISFINEIANLCEYTQADINDVRRGIGHDQRIGFQFLFPGVGYGGSCFPKDVRAMMATGRQHDLELKIAAAVEEVNNRQKTVMLKKIDAQFGKELSGKTIALWGLAFKPRTDDIREAPAVEMIDHLLERGVGLQVHDPEAMDNVAALYGERIRYDPLPYDSLKDADALVIMTEWEEFRNPDFAHMRRLMRSPIVFDGRNLYEPNEMASFGFVYHSIGRASVGLVD